SFESAEMHPYTCDQLLASERLVHIFNLAKCLHRHYVIGLVGGKDDDGRADNVRQLGRHLYAIAIDDDDGWWLRLDGLQRGSNAASANRLDRRTPKDVRDQLQHRLLTTDDQHIGSPERGARARCERSCSLVDARGDHDTKLPYD